MSQSFEPNMHMHVRVDDRLTDTDALIATLRNEIRQLDSGLPILRLTTLRNFLDENPELWLVRFGGILFTFLGAAALFVALVGVYGVTAFLISQRTHEIGVRLALGATRQRIARQILREYLGSAFAGLVVGLILAIAMAQLMTGLLYQVTANEPSVYFVTTLFLAATSTLAAYLPVRRASRIEPTAALRFD
jgi:putative ABC transport system permease protein